MIVIGLTGGIGSGKTTVAKLFAEYNVPIVDADLIARELVEPGQPALSELVETFGTEILYPDGTLDRRRLRERVFADAGERRQLENILHPLIRAEMIGRLDEAAGPYAIMVVPLLIDTGNWEMIDRILVVDVDEATQMERVMQRDGIDRKQAEAIIDTQISRQDRLEAADDVIDNTEDITALREQVARLHQRYMNEPRDNQSIGVSNPGDMIVYEQPLNERIRVFLRLEQLFARTRHHIQANTAYDAHSVIVTLIEICNLIGRGDPKSEIIKELERQHASLKRHADAPGVDQRLLNDLLAEQSQCIETLHGITEQLSQHLQQDYLFSSVRQRLSIPGGTCDFDLPVYSHWLHGAPDKRAATLEQWFEPFEGVERAINVCLRAIRESADPVQYTAEGGYYEQTLDTGSDVQLIRVMLDAGSDSYPTISAGKHRMNVRLMQWRPGESRSPQTEADVPFSLMLCGI